MYGIVQMLIQIVYVNVFRKHITDLDTRRVLNCIAFIGCKLFALLEEPTWATSCKTIILFLYQFCPSRRAERIRVELGKGVHICFQHASVYIVMKNYFHIILTTLLRIQRKFRCLEWDSNSYLWVSSRCEIDNLRRSIGLRELFRNELLIV